jgi:hypothetical protein
VATQLVVSQEGLSSMELVSPYSVFMMYFAVVIPLLVEEMN